MVIYNLIKAISSFFVGVKDWIKSRIILSVSICIAFVMGMVVLNNYNQHKYHLQSIEFTSNVKKAHEYIRQKNNRNALIILQKLASADLTRHQRYLVEYLQGVIQKTAHLPSGYFPSSIEYRDASLFADVALDKYFLRLREERKYSQIIHEFLTIPCQDHTSIVPFLTYIDSIFHTQDRDILHTYISKLYRSSPTSNSILQRYILSLLLGSRNGQ